MQGTAWQVRSKENGLVSGVSSPHNAGFSKTMVESHAAARSEQKMDIFFECVFSPMRPTNNRKTSPVKKNISFSPLPPHRSISLYLSHLFFLSVCHIISHLIYMNQSVIHHEYKDPRFQAIHLTSTQYKQIPFCWNYLGQLILFIQYSTW